MAGGFHATLLSIICAGNSFAFSDIKSLSSSLLRREGDVELSDDGVGVVDVLLHQQGDLLVLLVHRHRNLQEGHKICQEPGAGFN